jgi:hypothetical protein
MKRLDDRTVELTEPEVVASDRFNEYLDEGYGIPEAANLALNEMQVTTDHPSAEFIEYLSDGTCQRYFENVVIKPEWRA